MKSGVLVGTKIPAVAVESLKQGVGYFRTSLNVVVLCRYNNGAILLLHISHAEKFVREIWPWMQVHVHDIDPLTPEDYVDNKFPPDVMGASFFNLEGIDGLVV